LKPYVLPEHKVVIIRFDSRVLTFAASAGWTVGAWFVETCMRRSHAVNKLNHKSIFETLGNQGECVLPGPRRLDIGERRYVPIGWTSVWDAIGVGPPSRVMPCKPTGPPWFATSIDRESPCGSRRQGRTPPLIEIDFRHSIFVTAAHFELRRASASSAPACGQDITSVSVLITNL
jgi:hypothetical protein